MEHAAESMAVKARHRVLAFFCCVAAVAYVQRSALGVPAAEIATALGSVDLARDMGMVQSAWYAGYAALQLPSGWLADRMGSRAAAALFAILWSLLTGFAGCVPDLASLAIVWGLMGAAQAGIFPCAAKAIGSAFPSGERARASGFLAAGMTMGGAIAPAVTAYALGVLLPVSDHSGIGRWRLLLVAYTFPGLAWAGIFLFLVSGRALPSTNKAGTSGRIDWAIMARSSSLWLLCAQQFFRAAAMVFFVTWFPVFLQKSRGVEPMESGLLATIAGAGAVVGSLLGGMASDWMLARTGNKRLSRQGLAFTGMLSCAILIMASSFIADAAISTVVIGLGAFCATFGGVSGYTVAIDLGGSQVATVFSTMNMCGNVGAALFPVAAGWLVSSTGNWNVMVYLFAGIMAVDAACWAALNPKGPLFGDKT